MGTFGAIVASIWIISGGSPSYQSVDIYVVATIIGASLCLLAVTVESIVGNKPTS